MNIGNIISNLDKNLDNLTDIYGVQIYIFLFLVVYLKTAFIVLTFLPGDSIVFASAALATVGELNLWILLALFIFATISGDSQNYYIGTLIRKWQHKKPRLNFLKENQVQSAEAFIQRYRNISIIFSRFIPFMRTTIPCVSAYTNYSFYTFLKFNSIGAVLWTFFWIILGYILGNVKWVENHLAVSLAIISMIPILVPVVFIIVKKGGTFRRKGNMQ